jgi:hypothetical protein
LITQELDPVTSSRDYFTQVFILSLSFSGFSWFLTDLPLPAVADFSFPLWPIAYGLLPGSSQLSSCLNLPLLFP